MEAQDSSQFPEALAVKLELLPVVFPLHMVTGGLALVLVPLAYALRHTALHKWAGRVAAVDVLIAGATAVPVALAQPVSPLAAVGFSVQGLLWLALLAKGVWHIRHGDSTAHRASMLLMAAVTSGAAFFRIYLALWAIYGSRQHFTTFYGINAWMAWGLPLTVVWIWQRRASLK